MTPSLLGEEMVMIKSGVGGSIPSTRCSKYGFVVSFFRDKVIELFFTFGLKWCFLFRRIYKANISMNTIIRLNLPRIY